MAVLTRKTCALAIRLLAQSLTRAEIETLLYEREVPNRWVVGDTKQKTLLTAFKMLEDQHCEDILLNVVQGAVSVLPPEPRSELEAALLQDGFVVVGRELVPEETRAQEHKSALQQLVTNHAKWLDVPTLSHHLDEAEDLFRKGKWDSSIGQARNFVEQLLADIATASSKAKRETPDLSRPVKVRDYLQACGFLDDTERKKLVDGVYGYFSDQGSHPGISEQSTARVCLSVLWSFGYYVLEKFGKWPDK